MILFVILIEKNYRVLWGLLMPRSKISDRISHMWGKWLRATMSATMPSPVHDPFQAKKRNCEPRTAKEAPQLWLWRRRWQMQLEHLHHFQEGSRGAMPRTYPRLRAPALASCDGQLRRLLGLRVNKGRNPLALKARRPLLAWQ